MSDDTRQLGIGALAIVALVALISFAALRGCESDKRAFIECVKEGKDPLECKAALR